MLQSIRRTASSGSPTGRIDVSPRFRLVLAHDPVEQVFEFGDADAGVALDLALDGGSPALRMEGSFQVRSAQVNSYGSAAISR
jgi:hypothetical protein